MPTNLVTLISCLLLAGSAFGVCYLVAAAISARRFAAKSLPPLTATPAATILKPLCGEDPELYENLRSFCRQDYPDYQIIFGVQDPRDPAIAIVRRLMAEFPEADLALVESGWLPGNLKVANLQHMLPAAKHQILVIADSDMRVGSDYLAAIVATLNQPGTGLVTCLYRGRPLGGLWSTLAAEHINHGFLPQALVGEMLGVGAGCFGATLALRRETLDAIGGFASISHQLADDHALGGAVRGIGQKVTLASYLVDNIVTEPSLPALFRHELRWARTVRIVAPAGFLGSLVTHPLVLAIIATALGAYPTTAPILLGIVLFCRCIMALVIDRAFGTWATHLLLVPFRDLLSFAVFIASFFTRTVAWRDQRFKIGPGGQLIPGRR